jgi:exonuclease SbcC
MVPLKLIISGFLSYREKVEIDFSGFDLACISGANGAGKSSLLDAITWNLFGEARKNDDSVINLHPSVNSAEVTFYFEYENNIYRIYRSYPRNKSVVLEFHILTNPESYWNGSEQQLEWKTLTERNKTETQKRIQKVLNLDYETFVNASFFLQNKADQFAQQTPSERKRILSNILGLDIWEIYRERAAERRRDAELEAKNLEFRLQEIEQELQEEAERKSFLKKVEEDLAVLEKSRSAKESQLQTALQLNQMLEEKRRRLQTLKTQMEQNKATLEEWQNRLAAAKEEQHTYLQILQRASEIKAAYAAWEQLRKELENWDQSAAQHYEYEKIRTPLLSQIAAEKARLEQELRHFQQQQAMIAQQADLLPPLQQRITELEQTIHELQSILEQRPLLEQKITETRNLQAELKAENIHLKTEMEELRKRIEQILQEEDAPCPVCGKPLPKAEREQLVAELTAQGKQRGDRFRTNKKNLEKLDQQENELQEN